VTRELYAGNSPDRFWRLLAKPEPSRELWDEAIGRAAAVLPREARSSGDRIESILFETLGEGQFGPDHWSLGSAQRAYYALKPLLPRWLTRRMKRVYGAHRGRARQLAWPIEDRYVRFQFGVVSNLLEILGRANLPFIDFWPDGRRFAFVLTHDIETAEGQAFASNVADIDAAFGFRSCFNFVPERYHVDRGLMDELSARGFEIGVHGLRHDGRDFATLRQFVHRATRMNEFIHDFGTVGFRAPLTHRNPQWMQMLDIEYDGSFFDTDPYEPIAGGTMSIWPFQLGRFVELPYTLAQDYTVAEVVGETTPRLWLEKVEFIRANHGMALLNTHPDYLRKPHTRRIYSEFLATMRARADFHHGLPREVARWWRARAAATAVQELPDAAIATIDVDGVITRLEPASPSDQYASRTEGARSNAGRTA
jgi:peptidoglycan/xylan/chitin deacetylase (PgdA/CDA1 family)